MSKNTNTVIGTIEHLLQAVEENQKRAGANYDPGQMGTTTSHPSKNDDDGTQTAPEGSRTAENRADMKDQPNTGRTPDEAAAEGYSPESAEQSALNNGGNLSPVTTGKDPSTNTETASQTKADGQYGTDTSHPARTDKESSFESCCNQSAKLAEELCKLLGGEGQPAPDQPGKAAATAEAADAGFNIANMFAEANLTAQDKQAADFMVQDLLAEVTATAERRACKTAEFYNAYFAESQKLAEEEDGSEEPTAEKPKPKSKPEGSGEGGDGGATPPVTDSAPPAATDETGLGDMAQEPMPGDEMGGGGGDINPEELALLLQLLQGGEGMGGESAMADMGGGEMGGGGGELSPEDLAMLESLLAGEAGGGGEPAAPPMEDPGMKMSSKRLSPTKIAQLRRVQNVLNEILGPGRRR